MFTEFRAHTQRIAYCACYFLLSSAATVSHAANNTFNPAIGVVLNGTYAQFSETPEDYAIPGFALGGEPDPGTQGFSIGESEINISANIDPTWQGVLILAFGEEGAEVENAYVTSSSLADGFTLKAGRFFSGIGYLNEQHAHTWNFADSALAYRALLGTQYSDDGIQLRWLAPLPFYAEFGAEAFRGDAFPAGGSANKGRGSWSSFMHFGGDAGASNSWKAGVSILNTEANERESDDEDSPNLFSGTSNVFIADLVWKWAPNGNNRNQNISFQAEYLRSKNRGEFTPQEGDTSEYNATTSGWYAQTVYQFMPRWRVGLRYDKLTADDVNTSFSGSTIDNQGHQPNRSSIMLDYSGSEFSRVRVQYSTDNSDAITNNQLFIQYVMSLGAHSAHTF